MKEVTIMKNSVIKTALTIELIAAVAFFVLSLITSIRMGTRMDYSLMTIMFAVITCGFADLDKKEKNAKLAETNEI